MGKPVEIVLFIGAVWPEPKSSAGGARLMQLIHLFLKTNFQVHYCCAASETEYMEDLGELGVTTFSIELNNSSFDQQLEALNPSVVVFDRFIVEEQFGWRVAETCPNAIRIIETIDLHCLRLARQEQLNHSKPLKSLLLNSEVAKREIAAIYRSDLSLMISTAEMHILQEVFQVSSEILYYLPFRVGDQLKNSPQFCDREGFLSIGNFKHAPNWDAVRYLKSCIFPLIRKRLPKANLYVYGSYSDDKAMQLNNPKQGFHVLGRAENAMNVMKNARVCLAPLRFGAGIKGKLIEAMLCGTPSVTTSIGAEGMREEEEWNGVVTDDELTMVNAAVELHEDKASWKKASEQGERILKNHFDPEVYEVQLIQQIKELLKNLEQHRQTNFIGSMLMHHSLKSTKYLSKWIESKNSKREQ